MILIHHDTFDAQDSVYWHVHNKWPTYTGGYAQYQADDQDVCRMLTDPIPYDAFVVIVSGYREISGTQGASHTRGWVEISNAGLPTKNLTCSDWGYNLGHKLLYGNCDAEEYTGQTHYPISIHSILDWDNGSHSSNFTVKFVKTHNKVVTYYKINPQDPWTKYRTFTIEYPNANFAFGFPEGDLVAGSQGLSRYYDYYLFTSETTSDEISLFIQTPTIHDEISFFTFASQEKNDNITLSISESHDIEAEYLNLYTQGPIRKTGRVTLNIEGQVPIPETCDPEIFDDFDSFNSDLWRSQPGYKVTDDYIVVNYWDGVPDYGDSAITMNPDNNSGGAFVSKFCVAKDFWVEVSGKRQWYSPAANNATHAMGWVGIWQAHIPTEYTADPGHYTTISGYKSHQLWHGLASSRVLIFSNYTHYPINLNQLFLWQNGDTGTRYFHVAFERSGNDINTYAYLDGGWQLLNTYQIERPNDPLYFEFVEADASSSAHSTTSYSYFDKAGTCTKIRQSTLFIQGPTRQDNNIDLYERAYSTIDHEIDLFTQGLDSRFPNMSGNISLTTTGFEQRLGLTCPILDPAASIQISDELIDVYQIHIDALLNQLGKNVLLEFDPIVTPCHNCKFDAIRKRSTGIYNGTGPSPFVRGRICPVCNGNGVLETKETRCIKCLIKWNPRDYKHGEVRHENSRNIVRTKCMLTEAHWIQKCKTALMNYAISDTITLRVRRLRGPIPTGLRERRYCITFWEIVCD